MNPKYFSNRNRKKKIKVLVTLGPGSLNKNFLEFCKSSNVSLLRLNMSHIKIKNLEKHIKFIRKYNKTTPICIDTEGAQIRTKARKKVFLKKNKIFYFSDRNNPFSLYPLNVLKKLKKQDVLSIGFENLKAKVTKTYKNKIQLKVIQEGFIEGNKGVHVENRSLELKFLTNKDYEAIKIGKKNKIKNYALSFTSSAKDINQFKNILSTENKIYKIETKKAFKKLKQIIKAGEKFLIDRGDLSKDINIEKIPSFQRKIVSEVKKYKSKEVYIATNLLESMVKNLYPTRAEANDIFNCLEMGAKGLVLAAETAVGLYPKNSVLFLKKMINEYLKFKN